MKNIVILGLTAIVILCAGVSAQSCNAYEEKSYKLLLDEARAGSETANGCVMMAAKNGSQTLLADKKISAEDKNKMLSARHAVAFFYERPASRTTHARVVAHPPSITLNSGYSMPVFGLGTWTLDNDTAESCVYTAIRSGYRLIDTARYYGNELGVGRGVRKAIAEGIISREDVFITSKIVPADKRNYDALINESNNALGLKYIDLMLIHQPGYGDKDLYKALERAVKSGKVRSIGISNYYTPEDYEYIAGDAEIPPAVVQNENHPYYQNTELQKYLQRSGVFIESWYPLGGRGHTQELFADPVIAEIAQAHRKSPAQVIIRWHIQAGYIVIPGSKNPEHIRENIDVFDFELIDDEMKAIQNLNRNRRFENW